MNTEEIQPTTAPQQIEEQQQQQQQQQPEQQQYVPMQQQQHTYDQQQQQQQQMYHMQQHQHLMMQQRPMMMVPHHHHHQQQQQQYGGNNNNANVMNQQMQQMPQQQHQHNNQAGGQQQVGGQQQQGSNGVGAKSSRICRHFVRGRCTWGAQCRFSHDVAALQQEQGAAGAVVGGAMNGTQQSNGTQQMGAGFNGYNNGGNKQQLHQSLRPRMDMQQGGGGQQQQGGGGQQGGAERQAWLGAQQATLQSQRHAILIAALQAKFQIRTVPTAAAEGESKDEGENTKEEVDEAGQRGQVILTSLTNAPEIVITVYKEEQVTAMLEQLEGNASVVEGGLHYLIGESSVFWSMMRLWHVNGTTTSERWDASLDKAATSGTVDCMFAKTATGCLTTRCNFEHGDAPHGVDQLPAAKPTSTLTATAKPFTPPAFDAAQQAEAEAAAEAPKDAADETAAAAVEEKKETAAADAEEKKNDE